MKTIASYVDGYDNNFNLIRFAAAVLVIWAHSYDLSASTHIEPITWLLGLDTGSIAVHIFFVISGFLIARSYSNRPQIISYLRARFLRIFPGLVGAVLFTVFIVGTLFTTVPAKTYWSQWETYEYIVINSLLIFDGGIQLRYQLPGLFLENSRWTVNGSLWTLPYEIWMYTLLLGLGISGLVRNRWALNLGLLLFGIFYVVADLYSGLAIFDKLNGFERLSSFFLAGVLVYVNRDRIPISLWVLVGLIAMTALFWQSGARGQLFSLTLIYSVFWFGYVPAGAIRQFNEWGDYSYGMYIYAYPIQQSFLVVYPQIEPMPLFLGATGVTLLLAIFSWHAIEKPALQWKKSTVGLPWDLLQFRKKLVNE